MCWPPASPGWPMTRRGGKRVGACGEAPRSSTVRAHGHAPATPLPPAAPPPGKRDPGPARSRDRGSHTLSDEAESYFGSPGISAFLGAVLCFFTLPLLFTTLWCCFLCILPFTTL